jgi:hypothetical protein
MKKNFNNKETREEMNSILLKIEDAVNDFYIHNDWNEKFISPVIVTTLIKAVGPTFSLRRTKIETGNLRIYGVEFDTKVENIYYEMKLFGKPINFTIKHDGNEVWINWHYNIKEAV